MFTIYVVAVTFGVSVCAVDLVDYFTEDDIIVAAKVLYTECGGINNRTEQACVLWTACNRVDIGYSDTISGVLKAKNQYAYYPSSPVTDELYNLAKDVLERWQLEKNGYEDVGRVLPSEYLWFYGDGAHNHFRDGFSAPYNIWDYSLETPYDEDFTYDEDGDDIIRRSQNLYKTIKNQIDIEFLLQEFTK